MLDLHQHAQVLTDDMAELFDYLRSREYAWGYQAVRAGGWTAVGTANVLSGLAFASEGSYMEFSDLVTEVALMLADRLARARATVQRMNDLGHNAAKAIWPTHRTSDDADFKACADKGGLIGITAVPNSLSNAPDQDITCVLDHYDYMVAIGTDMTIGDYVGFHKLAMGRDVSGLASRHPTSTALSRQETARASSAA